MAGAQGAAADAAPRHRAGGVGQGDYGWLCRHRLQVTALGSPGVWVENKTPSVPVARTWGDTTQRGRDAGGGCIATSAPALPAHPRHGVTTAPPPAQRPRDQLRRVCLGLL